MAHLFDGLAKDGENPFREPCASSHENFLSVVCSKFLKLWSVDKEVGVCFVIGRKENVEIIKPEVTSGFSFSESKTNRFRNIYLKLSLVLFYLDASNERSGFFVVP